MNSGEAMLDKLRGIIVAVADLRACLEKERAQRLALEAELRVVRAALWQIEKNVKFLEQSV